MPYENIHLGAKSAPFHNGITVGCWASSGHYPLPALDKSAITYKFMLFEMNPSILEKELSIIYFNKKNILKIILTIFLLHEIIIINLTKLISIE